MKNIAYAGALAALLGMDTDIIRALLNEKYGAKKALMDSNQKAVALGFDYAKDHFDCPLADSPVADGRDQGLDPDRRQHVCGAGVSVCRRDCRRVVSDHSGDVADGSVPRLLQQYRRDPETKKNLACILQAEDELAAIGMVIGAAWAGARAFTPDRRAGHFADERVHRPGLLRRSPGGDLRRATHGPSTGMPTRTQQGDLMMCAYASHGDTRHHLSVSRRPA